MHAVLSHIDIQDEAAMLRRALSQSMQQLKGYPQLHSIATTVALHAVDSDFRDRY